MQTECSIPECDKLVLARGWCGKHYQRWAKYGDPLTRAIIRGDDVARFWSKVDKSSGHWFWLGGKDKDGYGKMKINGRTVRPHRFAYELLVGPIPDGLELDHLCRVHACVWPEHLEPVTSQENVLRSPVAPAAVNAQKTHCPQGHPYDLFNTYLIPNGGGRACRTCRRLTDRELYRKHQLPKRA